MLFAAGESLAPGYAHAPHDREARQQALEALGTSLGATRLAELQAQGAAMTDAEIVDLAHTAIARHLARASRS